MTEFNTNLDVVLLQHGGEGAGIEGMVLVTGYQLSAEVFVMIHGSTQARPGFRFVEQFPGFLGDEWRGCDRDQVRLRFQGRKVFRGGPRRNGGSQQGEKNRVFESVHGSIVVVCSVPRVGLGESHHGEDQQTLQCGI